MPELPGKQDVLKIFFEIISTAPFSGVNQQAQHF